MSKFRSVSSRVLVWAAFVLSFARVPWSNAQSSTSAQAGEPAELVVGKPQSAHSAANEVQAQEPMYISPQAKTDYLCHCSCSCSCGCGCSCSCSCSCSCTC